ncbi:unnamed protein product, partial [Ixodes persulcatus]
TIQSIVIVFVLSWRFFVWSGCCVPRVRAGTCLREWAKQPSAAANPSSRSLCEHCTHHSDG